MEWVALLGGEQRAGDDPLQQLFASEKAAARERGEREAQRRRRKQARADEEREQREEREREREELTPEQKAERDARTVFVGNFPVKLANNRAKVHKHFTQYGAVESIRVRNVANTWLSVLGKGYKKRRKQKGDEQEEQKKKPDGDEEEQKEKEEEQEQPKEAKKKRKKDESEKKKKDDDDDEEDENDEHEKELDDDRQRETCSLYVVFKEKESVERALAENGSDAFCPGFHLRVDRAVAPTVNTKKSLFLGNLPFDVADEEVRAAFVEFGEIEYVRIIRDKMTGKGTGIGYVCFKKRDSAKKAAESKKPVNVRGRKLRVDRCMSQKKKEIVDKKKERKKDDPTADPKELYQKRLKRGKQRAKQADAKREKKKRERQQRGQ